MTICKAPAQYLVIAHQSRLGRSQTQQRGCRVITEAGGGSNNGAADRSVGSAVTDRTENAAQQSRPQAPWTLTFDLRERDTLWTEENQARLVRIVASRQLNCSREEVDQRMDELAALLPQLATRCAFIKPSTLADLLRDPPTLSTRLLGLRDLLPSPTNISELASAAPELVLLRDLAAIQADLERLKDLLGSTVDIGTLVQAQPQFLDAQLVSEVLDELGKLMPECDPVQTLLSDTSWLLRVERGRGRLGDDPD